jgi:epsilon-lactone hydrolase
MSSNQQRTTTIPTYNAATEAGLQAWRESLADLLEILSGASDGSMEELRARYTKMLLQHPRPEGITVSQLMMGRLPAMRITPSGSVHGRTLLYFHGGAYLFGSAEGYVALGGRLARALRAEVIIPEYRLAPEHPYPTPILDCVEAYEWLLEQGQDPAATVFAGDSAGGALTVSVMVHARDRNLPLPAAGIAISPWVEIAHTGESMRTREGIDPLCSRGALDIQAGAFLAGASATAHDASPVHADLHGLPPILVQVGEAEVMLSGGIQLATRLGEQRVDTELQIAANMFHVWHLFAAVLPEGQRAIDHAARFAVNALERASARTASSRLLETAPSGG